MLEQQGRWRAAIEWARADLEDVHNRNAPGRARTGRLLGRCHAALGEHALGLHALDAAHCLRLHCRTASEVLAQLRELLEPALMDVAALGRA